MVYPFFDRHRVLLEKAADAVVQRGHWSPYPEVPSTKVYGEIANADGKAAFEARLEKPFELTAVTRAGFAGREQSPYGFELGISYPKLDVETLIAVSGAAFPQWRKAGPQAWVGVALEILQRLNQRSFEMAYAVMHTTGQSFVMAFQAGGPHAQDRGLEAVAWAWRQMRDIPPVAQWEKPQGKHMPLRMKKELPHRPARHCLGHRLLHLPDMEQLSRPVRQPGHRQYCNRQTPPRRDSAAGAYC